jgi:hypothetical protein
MHLRVKEKPLGFWKDFSRFWSNPLAKNNGCAEKLLVAALIVLLCFEKVSGMCSKIFASTKLDFFPVDLTLESSKLQSQETTTREDMQ